MHLLFETGLNVLRVAGNMHFFVRKPCVSPEPVLVGDTPADSLGAHVYGSVHHDQGVYRMWYQASAPEWSRHDAPAVGYAESDDGITWRKPALNLVEHNGSTANNLCDLGFHDPSISILPDAPPERRYVATGCIDARYQSAFCHRDAHPPVGGGYYSATSADGLHWALESPDPIWPRHWADNIVSVWHPGRGHLQVLAKKPGPRLATTRRNWWECKREGRQWSPLRMSLVPDEFDDVAARARGYASGDYNGFGLMPARRATVAFIQTHRNRLPYRDHPCGRGCGVFGVLDLTLAWQEDEGACWVHMPGRPDFIASADIPWAGGMVFCASNVCAFGDEQRLYISGTSESHGVIRHGARPDKNKIGYLGWPTGRLFGYRADDVGELDIDLGVLTEPVALHLNYETETGGSLRVGLHTLDPYARVQDGVGIDGRSVDACIPLTGDALAATVRWKDGAMIRPVEGKRVVARVYMERARAYGYEGVSADSKRGCSNGTERK